METWLLPQMLLPLQVSPSRIAISSTTQKRLCQQVGMAFSMLPDTACPSGARVPTPSSPCRLQALATSGLAAPSIPSSAATPGAPVTCLPGLGHLGCRWCRPPPLNRSPPGHGQDLVSSSQGSRTSTPSDLAFSALACPSAAGPLPSLRPVGPSCCRHTHLISLRSLGPLLGLARTPRCLL